MRASQPSPHSVLSIFVEAARAKAREGHALNEMSDFAGARDAFHEAYQMCPPDGEFAKQSATYLFSAGNMALKANDVSGAKARFDELLGLASLDPTFRAQVYEKLGDARFVSPTSASALDHIESTLASLSMSRSGSRRPSRAASPTLDQIDQALASLSRSRVSLSASPQPISSSFVKVHPRSASPAQHASTAVPAAAWTRCGTASGACPSALPCSGDGAEK
jgi:tetratricopeptide (TPR) repeat protein